MRRFVSTLAALMMLAATTTTTTLAADVQTVVEGGHIIGIAEIGHGYSGLIDARNNDTVVAPNGVPFQAWKFQARAGQCVEITMRSQTLDSLIQVFDGNTSIANDDDGGGNLDAHLWLTLSHDGWYYLATAISPDAQDTSPTRGTYTLNLSQCASSTPQSPGRSAPGPSPSSNPAPSNNPAPSSGPTRSTGPAGSTPSNGSNNTPLPRY
jgi:hypothetical protein